MYKFAVAKIYKNYGNANEIGCRTWASFRVHTSFSANCGGGTNTVPKVKSLGKKEDLFQNLNYLLDKKKVYLDAHVSLISLSKMLYTNTAYLSKVINMRYGCNLKTLLNRCRVDYAKQLLQQEECDIGSLPERCGFLSRSAFYASFSRFEGQTPTDYRSHMLSIRLRSEG